MYKLRQLTHKLYIMSFFLGNYLCRSINSGSSLTNFTVHKVLRSLYIDNFLKKPVFNPIIKHHSHAHLILPGSPDTPMIL